MTDLGGFAGRVKTVADALAATLTTLDVGSALAVDGRVVVDVSGGVADMARAALMAALRDCVDH